MSPGQNHPFVIKEVTSPQSQYLTGMNRWLELIFPEYCPPRFGRLLSRLRRPDGRHQIQIFIGLIDNQVAGLVQLFYREWQGGLLSDIDLLGVLEPVRRSGLALALVQQSLRATFEIAQQYQLPAIGVATLIDPQYAPIVGLHQKQGGQIRADYQYPSGDVIVWYPMQRKYEDIVTPILGEQLRQFGRLLET
jgi:hypothetical protein